MTVGDFHKFCMDHKKIYCYGAGRYGRTILVHLREHGLDIDSFLITGKPDEDEILGRSVKSIMDIDIDETVGIILAIGARFLEEMKQVLHERNIRNYMVVDAHLLSLIEESTQFNVDGLCARSINVLMYHRVVNDSRNIYGISVSPRNFDLQMQFLKNHYHVLRFDEDWSSVKEPAVVVTFDDGYEDNYRNALPILEKYEIPATFFVSTGNIGTGKLFWWDSLEGIFSSHPNFPIRMGERQFSKQEMSEVHAFLHDMLPDERDEIIDMALKKVGAFPDDIASRRSLSVDELRRLSESPFSTIGVHTVTHSSLIHMSLEKKRWEINESKARLEKILSRKIDIFSYPFGDYDDDTLSLLPELNFKKACTVTGGLAFSDGGLRIPRNKVLDVDSTGFEKFLRQCQCIYESHL